MQNVIICGDCGEMQLTKSVMRACAAYGGLMAYSGGRFVQSSTEPVFNVISAGDSLFVNIPGAIIVFGKKADNIPQRFTGKNCVCVLDADDEASRLAAAAAGAESVGCSLSGNETLTISGITDDSGFCVSLGRSLPQPGRKRGEERCPAELCDFPVYAPGLTEYYPVLAAAAVLLLGGIDTSEGLSF